MATRRPNRLTIRTYDVGFGDCFLLTFHYGRTKRHVLIDFGSTSPAKKGKPLEGVIAEDIARVTGGKLHAVVVTHRHADHISGFTPRKGKGPGDVIRKCAKNALIIQPWTEDPAVAPKAKEPPQSPKHDDRSLAIAQVRSMEAMHEIASIVRRSAGALDMTDIGAEPQDDAPSPEQSVLPTPVQTPAPAVLEIGSRSRESLAFLGETNLKNDAAIRNLMSMSTKDKHRYVSFGSKSGLESVLPGVQVEVLGPPTVAQSKDVLKERRNDQAEFWMLAAAATRLTVRPNKTMFPNERHVPGSAAPPSARWFIKRMRGIRAQQLFEIVRIVDDALNNTSVILLFTIGKTRLLFPGDAQIENWQYALKLSANSKRILEELSKVNVYKVGHHGSRNATPKTLWNEFKNRKKGLKAVMSTKSGKFPGRTGSGTEVPRETLKRALQAETQLTNTQELAGTKQEFFIDLDVPLK